MTLIRDRSLAELLDAAFGLYRANLRLFLLLAAGVVVPVDLIVGGIGLGQLTSGYNDHPTIGEAIVPSAVSALVTVPLITAMQVRALLALQEGRTPSAGEIVRQGLDLFAPMLAVVLMVGLGAFVGFIALLVPGFILLVHWSVAAQAVAAEGRRGSDALRRSWQLVSGDAWWVFGVLIVTNLLAGVLGTIVTLPAASAAQSADSALILLLASMVVEPFTLSFQALATTLLFFTLLARKEGPVAPDPTLGHPEAPYPAPAQDEAPTAPVPPGWEPPRPGG